MLSVVETDNTRGRFLPKVWEKEPLVIEGKQVRRIAVNRRRHLPLKRLRTILGNNSVLLDTSLQREKERLNKAGFRLCKEVFSDLNQRWAVCCAVQILGYFPFPRQKLGLIDPQLRYRELAFDALMQLNQVYLCTEQLSAAEQFAWEMMEQYGATVFFSQKSKVLEDCPLSVRLGEGEFFLDSFAGTAVLLPNETKRRERAENEPIYLSGISPKLPVELCSLPKEFPTEKLLHYLYLRQGCKNLAFLPAETLWCSAFSEKMTVEKASCYLLDREKTKDFKNLQKI